MKYLQRSFFTFCCAIALVVAGCAAPTSSGITVGGGSNEGNTASTEGHSEKWKKVTGATSGISLEVPENWYPIGQEVDDTTARSNIEKVTKGDSDFKEIAENQREANDIAYIYPNPGGGAPEAVLLGRQKIPVATLSSTTVLRRELEANPEFTVHHVEEIQSPLGQGYMADIELTGDVKGKDIYVPNGKGFYFEVALLSQDESALKQRYEKVLQSLSLD
ncbi:MAG: hypothetical protein Q4C87_01255 [Actinomycetaceae bacterium]|nr:hypothetical protein [Actinomycetaceae bacterium]